MSSGSGTPSFGDLFDDPDDAGSPSTPPASAKPVDAATPVTEVAPEPAPEAEADAGAEPEHEVEPAAATAAVASRAGSVSVSAAGTVDKAETSAATDADADSASSAESDWDGSPDPALAVAAAGRIDTGRLYRSAGAEGPATLDAIPALDPARLAKISTATTAAATAGAAAGTTSEPRAAKTPRLPSAAREPRVPGAGLTYSGVVVIVGASTLVVGLAEALLRHQLGWLTGLALFLSSVYCAVMVRKPDAFAAVFVPPLAFLVTALTAGMLTLDSSGGLISRIGFALFRNLATNAPWILGTTAVCLVIVLVRRTRD